MGISSRLTTTATHTRISRASNSRGGYTQTWSSQGSVSCRISRRSTTERTVALREEGLGQYTIYVLSSEDIQVHDRLTANSLVYEIVGITRPSRGIHLELDAKLIEEGA